MQATNAVKPEAIERFAVDSSTIKAIGYADGVLVVEFTNGHLYAYNMAPAEFEAFARAESKGSYFNKTIRGKVEGRKLTGACANCLAAPQIIGATCACGGTVVPMVSKAEAKRLER
jgi:hypothetical protein